LDIKTKLYPNSKNPENPFHYRGYKPFEPNDPSHKEFYEEGLALHDIIKEERDNYPLYENKPFNPESKNLQGYEGLKEIREVFDNHNKVMYKLGLQLIRYLSVGLGKNEDFFDEWFVNGSLTTFRSIHYKPRNMSHVDNSLIDKESMKLTTPEHSDSGFITILTTFGSPGLQVLIDGEYKSIKPEPNALVVNLGDLFAKLTDYKLKSTFHRVLDIGVERWSAPCFIEPKYSARIFEGIFDSKRKTVNDEEFKNEDLFLFGDWLIKRFTSSYVEWKDYEIPEERKESIKKITMTDFKNDSKSKRIIANNNKV